VTDDTSTPAPNARLVITRNRESDCRYRQIFASLDGNSVGDLLFGERLVREMSAGPHTLKVHNTLFWRTIPFDARPGETVQFATVNYSGRGFWSIALILGVAPLFLKVEREQASAGS
jgi:hypothetical protein